MRRLVTYTAVPAVVLVLWWALTASGAVAPLILPPVDLVGTALREQLTDPAVWSDAMWVTVRQAVTGFLLAAVLALPLGVLLGRNRLLSRAYEPLLATLSAVPLIVLYPVFVATLGIGATPKVVLGALYAFFPIGIATVRAVGQVNRQLMTAMRSMGAQGHQLLREVIVPSALPAVISGLRLGFGLAMVTVIAAEFIAGSDGVGYQLAAAGQGYNSPDLFAWVVLVIILTVLSNAVLTVLTSLLEGSIRR